MATWRIETRGTGRRLVYWNGLSRRRYDTGDVTEMAAEKVVEWVVDHARPFDILLFEEGTVFLVLPERGVQA